jgi:hypothetical protein
MGAAPSRKAAVRTEGAEMAPFHTFGIGWERTSAPIASTPASTPSTDSVNRMPFSGVVSFPFSIRKQASLVTPVIVPVIRSTSLVYQNRCRDVSEMARQLRLAAGRAAIPSHEALVRMIRRWESGGSGMSERYQLLCRRALESGLPVTVSAAALEAMTRAAALQGEGKVQRREFLTASAAVAGSLTVPPQLARLAAGRRIGADVPKALSRRLARLRRLDNYLGGGETYHLYAAELDATKTLAREASCTEETNRELLAVVSEQAQQAGWAAFDAGWQATARTLYQDSLTAAQYSGSRALEGNALALLAYQNLTTGEPAASFADASCDAAGSRTPPRVRALLHERRAWAIAHTASGRDECGGHSTSRRQRLRNPAASKRPTGRHGSIPPSFRS